MPSKKHRTNEVGTSSREPSKEGAKKAPRVIFFPACVYEHVCVGILFTACSIRGRGTMVFSVTDLEDPNKLLALKMAWQDLQRLAQQEEVMERLNNNDGHPNVVVPIRSFQPKRDGKRCTTLDVLRGFLEDQIEQLPIENHVLTVSVSELKRPVRYFWGVHDFVRGLRGALSGHEYLTKIGVLHLDVSENNIVLGRRPGDERGYLIDFDTAVLYRYEEPVPIAPPTFVDPFSEPSVHPSPFLLETNERKSMKGIRTGTLHYISYNVLLGGSHTYFDDVESFLYVLLLFVFSYAGSLSEDELRAADAKGFSQPVGAGRLSHLRRWPKRYAEWADGDPEDIALLKQGAIVQFWGTKRFTAGAEFLACLGTNWPASLHQPIVRLIEATFTTFRNNTQFAPGQEARTTVAHATFIAVLDKWLEIYSDLEDAHSNCPFKARSESYGVVSKPSIVVD